MTLGVNAIAPIDSQISPILSTNRMHIEENLPSSIDGPNLLLSTNSIVDNLTQ
ncbi:Hypothetical predicted protein, partial [Olea europaea subsp. europaea]